MNKVSAIILAAGSGSRFGEKKQFKEENFAITDISNSRTIIELEGNLVNEVLKKGCPLDINNFKEGDCANSVYNLSLIHI